CLHYRFKYFGGLLTLPRKTQIALEYVYQHAGGSDCHVFWVHGSGAQRFREGFRAIAH
ncbi:unnamed protein product, partial [Tuber aestivum]